MGLAVWYWYLVSGAFELGARGFFLLFCFFVSRCDLHFSFILLKLLLFYYVSDGDVKGGYLLWTWTCAYTMVFFFFSFESSSHLLNLFTFYLQNKNTNNNNSQEDFALILFFDFF